MDPEQIKYVTALNYSWSDPNRFPESYVFLPSIRRARRLSSAARCAPFQGQDFSNDDPFPQLPAWCNARYVGLRPQLHYFYNPDIQSLDAATHRSNFYGRPGSFLFPKALMGKWQVSDVYTVEMSRLPQFQKGYCYARRLLYLDRELHITTGYDTWDQNGKYWRGEIYHNAPLQKSDGAYYNLVWSHCA